MPTAPGLASGFAEPHSKLLGLIAPYETVTNDEAQVDGLAGDRVPVRQPDALLDLASHSTSGGSKVKRGLPPRVRLTITRSRRPASALIARAIMSRPYGFAV